MDSHYLRQILEEPLEHRSLSSLEGYWKVVHHGNLVTAIGPEKTPRLVIYFRALVNQGDPVTAADFETHGPAVPISVPAAELMRLPLNVVVYSSRIDINPCVPLPSEEIDDLSVDLSESTVQFMNRYLKSQDTESITNTAPSEILQLDNRGPDDFIIPYREGRSPPPESEGGRAHYVAIEHNDDPFGIIIPCTEIFRFFYCTSSRMLYTILSDKILDVDRYIIDPSRSGQVEGNPKIAVVWLRQWMFNSDRRHIARLFFTPGAFDEAKKIFLRAGGYVDGGAFERALIALPPYQGKTKLRCIFKRFRTRYRERIFVTRIVSATNWTLPFDAIHFGRDNDGRSILKGKERDILSEYKRKRPNVLVKGAQINALANSPANDSFAPIDMDDFEFESRFPELEKIYSPMVEKHNQETKSDQGKKQLALADGSLVEGTSTTDKDLINVILHARGEAAKIKRENREKNSGDSEPLQELTINNGNTKLHTLIKNLEAARVDPEYDKHLEIQYLQVLDQLALLNGIPVNVLPKTFNDKSPKWLFIDDEKTQPRPVLVVQLTLDGKTRYIIDFMHKIEAKGDTATLLLWNQQELPIEDHCFEYAILTCMRNKRINLKGAELLTYLCGSAIRHTSTGNNHKHLISKIFTRSDNMSKWIRGVNSSTEEEGLQICSIHAGN